jgi:hypothetical protein
MNQYKNARKYLQEMGMLSEIPSPGYENPFALPDGWPSIRPDGPAPKKTRPIYKQKAPHGNTPTGDPNGPITYTSREVIDCNEFFPYDCTTYIISVVWQNGEIIHEGEPVDAREFYADPLDIFDEPPK